MTQVDNFYKRINLFLELNSLIRHKTMGYVNALTLGRYVESKEDFCDSSNSKSLISISSVIDDSICLISENLKRSHDLDILLRFTINEPRTTQPQIALSDVLNFAQKTHGPKAQISYPQHVKGIEATSLIEPIISCLFRNAIEVRKAPEIEIKIKPSKNKDIKSLIIEDNGRSFTDEELNELNSIYSKKDISWVTEVLIDILIAMELVSMVKLQLQIEGIIPQGCQFAITGF